MKRHQAFTLIELLVVISIIALLIGLLLPALGAAKDMAKKTHCLSGLKQTSIGAHSYAADNDGSWPMKFREDWGGSWEYMGNNQQTYSLFGSSSAEYGFGALYSNGYVSDTRAMYCSSIPDGRWNWGKTGVPKWVNADGYPGNYGDYTSYAWNPHLDTGTDPVSGASGMVTAYKKVDYHPADKTFVSDLIINFTNAHDVHKPTFNIGLGDGSARAGDDAELVYEHFIEGNRDLRGIGRVSRAYDALEGYGFDFDGQYNH